MAKPNFIAVRAGAELAAEALLSAGRTIVRVIKGKDGAAGPTVIHLPPASQWQHPDLVIIRNDIERDLCRADERAHAGNHAELLSEHRAGRAELDADQQHGQYR
jgi:hypothetical protein